MHKRWLAADTLPDEDIRHLQAAGAGALALGQYGINTDVSFLLLHHPNIPPKYRLYTAELFEFTAGQLRQNTEWGAGRGIDRATAQMRVDSAAALCLKMIEYQGTN